jgi:hypothetical protein
MKRDGQREHAHAEDAQGRETGKRHGEETYHSKEETQVEGTTAGCVCHRMVYAYYVDVGCGEPCGE